jgi:hydrogenase nickel incorporation protein HypB
VCKDCGCGLPGDVAIDGVPVRGHEHSPAPDHPHPHDHAHPHAPDHAHDHEHSHTHAHDDPHSHEHHRRLTVEQGILDKNDRLAERNRGFFQAKGVYVVNVLASPGAGKTAFIERTAADLGGRLRLGVIVGDLATENDAVRLRGHGIPAIQITTGSVCHLDAEMISRAKDRLDLTALDVLIIENVGNLVCPAVYDLGEDARVVLLSVTEGEDKPLKYPVMFQSAQLVVVNKMDIASAVDFDREAALRNIRRTAPHAVVLEVSARTGQGMEAWYQVLQERLRALRPDAIREPGAAGV